MPRKSSRARTERYRERMRAAGLRRVEIWAPDTRAPSFVRRDAAKWPCSKDKPRNRRRWTSSGLCSRPEARTRLYLLADKLSYVFTTVEAEVDEGGNIRPKEPLALQPGTRLLVTVLESEGAETALLSEAALAADWERPEEEAAWAHLSRG